MKRKFFIIPLLFLTVFACKKRIEPTDEVGTPVFYLDGLINNVPVKLEAGKNDFYLQTNYSVDNNNIIEFSGNLKQTCSNCKSSLRIVVRDYKKSQGAPVTSDSSLSNRSYDFNRKGYANIPYYAVHFFATPSGTASLLSEQWQFDDGSTSASNVVDKTFRAGTIQNIAYTCNYANTCSSTISYQLKLNHFLNPADLPDFYYSKIDSLSSLLKFTVTGGDTLGKYFWDFGDGGKATGATVYYGFSKASVHHITLMQIRGNDTMAISKNVGSGGNTDCRANFITQVTPLEDPLNLSTVVVEWTDEAGTTYSSGELIQDLHTNFTILGSEDYQINNSGMKTQMLKVQINCKLSNGSSTIEVKNLQGKIAVARP